MQYTIEDRLKAHKQFWQGEKCDLMLTSFRIGDYFFADKFAAARELLVPGKIIKPTMLDPERFLQDYENMYHQIEQIGQSGFFAAEPFIGIPWLEAILGCPVQAAEHSFISEPAVHSPAEVLQKTERLEKLNLDDNEWFGKYLEFTNALVSLAAGRFPVAQPILRGLSDAFGALAGQTEMIFSLYDNPQVSARLITSIVAIFEKIVARQFELIPEYLGGYAIGFYHVWTPGKCIWFQEDLSSILSPELFRTYLYEKWQEICSRYDCSAMHLHPSALHNLDVILDIENLKAVELNKDEEGPGVEDLLPVMRKILDAGKRLIIWGNLNQEEIQLIGDNFAGRPVFLSIVAQDVDTARKLMDKAGVFSGRDQS